MHQDPKQNERKVDENPLIRSRKMAIDQGKPFSLEPASMIKGVRFINDSAATNLERSAESLHAFEQPIVWITEANYPNPDFSPLGDIIESRTKAVIAVGLYASEIHFNLREVNGLLLTAETWEESIEQSLDIARANEIVLFSPGARSVQPFENYRERGAYFNRLIQIKMNTNT